MSAGDEPSQSTRGRFRYLFWFIAAAFAATIGYGILLARSVRPEYLSVGVRGLPAQAGGLKLLQVSDVHAGLNMRVIVQAAQILRSLPAKFLIMTGDFAQPGGSTEAAVAGARILADAVSGRMPVYAVQGETDSAEVMTGIQGAGIKVLDNQAVPLVAGLWLVGFNPVPAGHPSLIELLGRLPAGAEFILASHSPDVMLEDGSTKAKIVLTGHTHGGQIRLPFIRPLTALSRLGAGYFMGLYKYNECYLYINRGLGTTALPLRVYSPPEVASITLWGRQ
jgi:uncharacterized protein